MHFVVRRDCMYDVLLRKHISKTSLLHVGLAPEGVVRSSRPAVAPRGDTVFVTVHWDVGTDIELELDFGDGTDMYSWNWQVCVPVMPFVAEIVWSSVSAEGQRAHFVYVCNALRQQRSTNAQAHYIWPC